MFAASCTAVASFGDFHFRSDGDAGQPDGAVYTGHADGGGGCAQSTETRCDDHEDDDCDQLFDCDDPDCAGDVQCCKPNEIPEVSCSGGVDNDCDGLIDCEDPNCAASKACCSASGAEVGQGACSDGVDNDCDGIVDCAESACASQSSCCEAKGEENNADACGNGFDDDCDGKKDCDDSDCAAVSDCCTKSEPNETSCGDAQDNDCDGKVDCQDSDCDAVSICKDCQPTAASESSCTDLIDNDCDKDRDCWDSDCSADLACCKPSGAEQGNEACIDGVDNDCDGATDCADSECASSMDCCVATGSESGDEVCSDGVDNDCDGITDCDDDGCMGSQHCCVSTGDEVGTVLCNDGLDNDCNGMRDCADPKCGGNSACCVPNGTDANQPNDGADNDCNGTTDIAQASATYPPPGQPTAGNEVSITLVPSIVAAATPECSSRRLTNLGNAPVYTACIMNGGAIKPHTDVAAALASNDGAWVTDVRWRFGPNKVSEPFSFRYYIHHSLFKAQHCNSLPDQRWFDLARTRLDDTKTFKPGDSTDTALAGPFAHVSYELPALTKINPEFLEDGGKQTVEMWSLRKRMTLDAANKLLLITRNYVATRSNSCNAALLRFHINNYTTAYGCDAVVVNRAGAGVCMRNSGGTPVFAHDSNDPLASKIGWVKANKFMWRQLLDAPMRGKVKDYKFEENLSYRNFMPKCTSAPCKSIGGIDGIFLPDRAFFP